jgi:hypothetical protein
VPVLFKYTPYLRTFTIFDQGGRNLISDLFQSGWKERAYFRILQVGLQRAHLSRRRAQQGFASFFARSTAFLERVPMPVDADKDGALLARARQERAGETLARQSETWLGKFPFRDSSAPGGHPNHGQKMDSLCGKTGGKRVGRLLYGPELRP